MLKIGAKLTKPMKRTSNLKLTLVAPRSEPFTVQLPVVPPERRGSNWVHSSLEERAVAACGFGAFATGDIPAGTTIIVYGGRVLTESDFEALSPYMQNYPYQIEEELFLGPANEDDIGIGERLNHSCEPNAGFQGPIHIVTLRDIQAGEQVTIDYATCVSSSLDAFCMECSCGSPRCRGTITGQDWKLPEVQSRLLLNLQPFLQRKVAAMKGVSLAALLNDGAANTDTLTSRKEPVWLPIRAISHGLRWCVTFVTRAVREEWKAMVVSCLAALPSNLATCFLMEILAPLLLSLGWAQSEGERVALIAAVTPFIGYATYLSAYYAGMLFKERRDVFRLGHLSRRRLRVKLRVVWYDFLAHLPSDMFCLPLMGAAQGGLEVAGLSQFAAIFWSQFFADCTYAWKEPLFWHGAKRFVAWRDKERTKTQA